MRAILSSVLLLFMFSGCASYEEHAAKRTEQLRLMYPAGTSREEVQAKWNNRKPDFSASRPADGWGSHTNQYFAKFMNGFETKTGKTIASVDRYWGPDGLWSLAYVWYYYDSNSKLIDVEWEYKSD